MGNKIVSGLILSVFAVIILYYTMTVAYDVASPNSSEVLTFANMTQNNTTSYPIVVVNSISNATYEFPSARITTDDYGSYITMNGTEANSTYTIDYDYEADTTVWGMDMAFMAVLVIVGIGLTIILKSLGIF